MIDASVDARPEPKPRKDDINNVRFEHETKKTEDLKERGKGRPGQGGVGTARVTRRSCQLSMPQN